MQAKDAHRSRRAEMRRDAKVGCSYRRTSYGWQATLRLHIAKVSFSDRGRDQHSCKASALGERISAVCELILSGRPFALTLRMSAPMRTVYILKNTDQPPRFYTGITADLGARLEG